MEIDHGIRWEEKPGLEKDLTRKPDRTNNDSLKEVSDGT
jgi:hypothetical protein